MKTKITTLVLIALSIMSCNTGKKATSGTETNPDGIENTQWTMTALEGQDMSGMAQKDQPIHFTLNSKDNRVSGYSGCNTFMELIKLKLASKFHFHKWG